jgi:hypothetical protein
MVFPSQKVVADRQRTSLSVACGKDANQLVEGSRRTLRPGFTAMAFVFGL